MTILVTGATGTIGRHLVSALLERGAAVRALTRKPEDAGLPAGVEVVGGDMSDPAALGPEFFAGVDRVFVFPAEGGVDALVEAAVAAGVGRFVALSSLAAAKEHQRDVGSSSQVHHSAVEQAVTSRTDAWTILRPGNFASNLLYWSWPIRGGAPLRVPYPESAQSCVHEADVADVAAEALLRDDLVGEVLAFTGPESLSRREQAATIARAIGKEIDLVEITADEFRADVAPFMPDGLISMMLDYWRDTVSEPEVPRPVTPITGNPGRTLAEWAQDHRVDFGG